MHARSFIVENLHPNSSSKDILLPFRTILRAGPDPKALVRLQFPPSRTIDSLLTDYSQNYSCFRHTPLLLAKINSVTQIGQRKLLEYDKRTIHIS
jgi:hypothetical protein